VMWMAARERAYVRAASLVQAVSRRELRQLRTMFGSIPLGFVPNAVEIPAARSDPKVRLTQTRRIVFLGRLAVHNKGLDLLLEGYARHVRRTRDPASELIIAGPDFRGGRAELQSLAASLLPETRVSLPGPLFGGDKEALMKSAYVFVLTSRWEGMPHAVLEALATGCPVILTEATNLGEFVEDFGAGLLVDPTPDDIAEGLTRMLGTPVERYEAMCSAARRLVSELFTWPKVAEEISAGYRRILG
jgi:glycosyltransferase involved in cell wall biosynthesis